MPVWAVGLIAVVALALGLAIDASDDEPAADAAETANADRPTSTRPERTTTTRPRRTTTTKSTTTTVPTPERGTRDNPFDWGTPLVTSEGIEVTLVGIDLDPAAAIAAENMFNDPAPAGTRYILIRTDIVNNSDEPINPGWAVRVNAIGSQNRVHENCWEVIPNSLTNAPELYPGGSASGNVCVTVPEEEVSDDSLLLMVAPMFGDPVFVRPGA